MINSAANSPKRVEIRKTRLMVKNALYCDLRSNYSITLAVHVMMLTTGGVNFNLHIFAHSPITIRVKNTRCNLSSGFEILR